MDPRQLSDELRASLIESSEWTKIGLTLEESAEIVEEATQEAPEATEEEVVEEEEAAEVHVCPLCVSQLDEAIEEERILEHLNTVMGIVDRLTNLNEGEEDIDSVIDDAIAELLLQNDEETEEETTED